MKRLARVRGEGWRIPFVLLMALLCQDLPARPFLQSDSPRDFVERALAAYRQHDYQQARVELEASLRLFPSDAPSHELLGLALDLLGERPGAGEHLEEALRLVPNNATYRTNLVTYYLKSNMVQKADETLQPLLKTAPSADIYEMLGYIRLKQRQEHDAVPILQTALKLDPGRVESWYWLGFAYHSLGQFDDAISSYNEVLKRDPQNFRAHLQLGKIYKIQGVWPAALDHLTLATQILSNSSAAYRYLSEAQLAVGKAELARQSAQRAVQLKPDDPRAHYQLGQSLQRLGKTSEAKNEFLIAQKQNAASPPGSGDDRD